MATAIAKRQDSSTRRICAALRTAFPDLPENISDTVYRYNSVSIRIRIVSDVFIGMDDYRRDDEVMATLRTLPKEIRDDVTMILAFTSSEFQSGESLVNLEFDDPSRSRL